VARARPSTVRRRKKLNRLTHEIYKLFRGDNPWKVQLRRIKHNKYYIDEYGLSAHTIGFCFWSERIICVDYREEILSVFIHECLHAVYKNKTEEQIDELEEFMMENISKKQIQRLLRTIAANLS